MKTLGNKTLDAQPSPERKGGGMKISKDQEKAILHIVNELSSKERVNKYYREYLKEYNQQLPKKIEEMRGDIKGRLELAEDENEGKKVGAEVEILLDEIKEKQADFMQEYEEMIEKEKSLPEDRRMDFVSIVTPNHMHFPPAKSWMESSFPKHWKPSGNVLFPGAQNCGRRSFLLPSNPLGEELSCTA